MGIFAGLRQSGPLAAHFAHAENYFAAECLALSAHVPDLPGPESRPPSGAVESTPAAVSAIFSGTGEGKLEALVGATGLQAALD